MFFFSKKPKSQRLEDKVWFSKPLKYRAIVDEAKKAIQQKSTLFIVNFFGDTIEQVSNYLNQQNVQFHKMGDFGGNPVFDAENQIYLLNIEMLNRTSTIKTLIDKANDPKIQFLFVEHYPLLQRENDALQIIEELTNSKAVICFYLSLDEALIDAFGGERIREMIKRLGMSETDCLSHSLITKSITNAQQKLEKNISFESTSHSQSDWFRMNYKQ